MGEVVKTSREKVQEELEKIHKQHGVGMFESQQVLMAISLQIQLDIRDALDDILQVLSGIAVERKDQ